MDAQGISIIAVVFSALSVLTAVLVAIIFTRRQVAFQERADARAHEPVFVVKVDDRRNWLLITNEGPEDYSNVEIDRAYSDNDAYLAPVQLTVTELGSMNRGVRREVGFRRVEESYGGGLVLELRCRTEKNEIRQTTARVEFDGDPLPVRRTEADLKKIIGVEIERSAIRGGAGQAQPSIMSDDGPMHMVDEEQLYKKGIAFLKSTERIVKLRVFAPGAFALRDEPGEVGPKREWIEEIGLAMESGKVKNFVYVVGFSNDETHTNKVLEFLEESLVKKRGKATLELRYVPEVAERTSGGGLGFVMFDDNAFLLGCGVEKSAGPSRLDHSWLWNDSSSQALASGMSRWFDSFLVERTLELFNLPRLAFPQGVELCNKHFRSLGQAPSR